MGLRDAAIKWLGGVPAQQQIETTQGLGEAQGLGMPYPTWQFISGLWVRMADDPEKYIEAGYKGNSYMFAIVNNIVDKASDAPGSVYRITDQKKAKAYQILLKGAQNEGSIQKAIVLKSQAFEEVPNHPFDLLMRKPNPLQSEKEFVRNFLGYERITGNAFAYVATAGIGMEANKPLQLWVLPSPTVEIIGGTKFDPIGGYIVSYYFGDVIPVRKMIHMKTFNPVYSLNGMQWLYGMSPMQAGRSALGQFDASETAQGTLLKNMGPGGIISGAVGTGVVDITEPQAVAIQDKFIQRHTGILHGGGLVVTPAQLTYQQIGMSAIDLNIIAAKGDLLQEICAVYNYPKEKITGSSNTASQGVSDKQVVTSCVLPLLRGKDDCFTQFIREAYNDPNLVYISDTQYYPELQQDRKDIATWAGAAWWLTINEKRKAMDYEEISHGDEMLVPSGLSKLEDVIAPPAELDVNRLDAASANDYAAAD